ncbi:hypothetical protein LCGC14_2334820 [marine sediment metagenome]|uniref:Uncharacterized protein n=1 Tax=marine sediment metagenome TaxID=412755 RepID=A0A0F9CDQ8_9ZZZZ
MFDQFELESVNENEVFEIEQQLLTNPDLTDEEFKILTLIKQTYKLEFV